MQMCWLTNPIGALQESSPGAGFGRNGNQLESEAFDPDSHFLFWKPGTVPYTEPEGMALRLDAGTDLILNIHLQPSGKPEWIQPSLGCTSPTPRNDFPMLVQLENDGMLDIPPAKKISLSKMNLLLQRTSKSWPFIRMLTISGKIFRPSRHFRMERRKRNC